MVNQRKRFLCWGRSEIPAGEGKRAGSVLFVLYIKQEVQDITVLYLIIFAFK
jgi:hypothetical protein